MKSIKLLLVSLLFVLGTLVSIAQDKREHVVAKGETLSSIANKYSVSEADLISENPALKNYIYVGMKIRIPEEKKQVSDVERSKKQVENQGSQETTYHQQSNPSPAINYSQTQKVESNNESASESSYKSAPASRWGVADKFGFYFSPQKNQPGYLLAFSGGVDFAIAKFFFVEGLIGYGFNNSNYSMDYGLGNMDVNSNKHYIIASQYANFFFPIGNVLGAGVFTGPEEYFFLTGSQVINKEKSKIQPSNRFSFAYSVGAKLYIGSFTVGAEYKIALTRGGAGSVLGFFVGYTFG